MAIVVDGFRCCPVSWRWVLEERIQRLDPALFKVRGVSRDDGERVAAGGGGDLAVQGGTATPVFPIAP